MRLNGHWILIPNGRIQYRTLEGDTGETAGGHWCGLVDFEVTYCAILPPGFSFSVNGENFTKQDLPAVQVIEGRGDQTTEINNTQRN
jgi:hypothetical protein